ncbi:MAG: type II toxin-antitoxin system RelE/ParE family toxin [Erysipelotrichaceae bacterium]|nr:type II toxin-antitoxin system RelE/ParE family toxin [Erysipelotrichaceae bacterium]
MNHTILRTDKFDEELFNIIYYIAASSHSKEIALNYLSEIEEATEVLKTFPQAGVVPKNRTLSRQGFRALVVAKHHMIFYKVNNNQEVILYHIVDIRRNYIKLVR